MTPIEAYQTYLAVKLHFTSEKYDAFKYKFRTGIPDTSFYKRRDKYFFEKVARKYPIKRDLVGFYVSHFIEDVEWIGHMFEDDDTYYKWTGRLESCEYRFKSEISGLWSRENQTFDRLFINDSGDHPVIIKELIADDISLETVSLFDKTVGAVNEMPDFDPIIWPRLKLKIQKYKPFLPYDRKVYTKILSDILQSYK